MTTSRSTPRTPEHPAPEHFLLHLSDTHLRGGDAALGGTIDAEARLQMIFADLEAAGCRPEALLFTGDLADKGEPDAYAKLRAIVEPAARRMGADVVWAMGNHDDRGALRAGLLDEAPSADPLDTVHWLGGLRIVVLDTSVPGAHHGELTGGQLDWLAAELATDAPEGTLLALHHPPVPSVQPLAVLVELRGQAELAEVLHGTDVRAILGGHLHYSTAATFDGIPVSVASATCYTQDLAATVDAETGIRGTRGRDSAQSYNLVHVFPDTVVHSVVPAAGGEDFGEIMTPLQVQRVLEEHGIRYDGGAESASAWHRGAVRQGARG
ncbi:phosphodiesterase [Zhihengliuella salsuginis]|uniref:3',5'-cyclic adenosine monophosphate phosphodiesterase CpdA n=1 Tax=Zhihengliuella salsuginis TaxID=578222 RepID=A0ABQ3GB73_9MICC|nr:phosphodiesterase [Zhihengliuella salsuginis]GHC99050.1 3',5'-cyclic adenosine monophosphate phosphodiesterase CpdA [Zhihengliuella salsuginis]